MSGTIWIPAGLVFVTVVLGTVALALVSELLRDWRRQREVSKRLKPVLMGQTRKGRNIDSLLRGEESSGLFEAASRLIPGLRGLETLLEQARLDWGLPTFLILTTGFAIGFGAPAFVVSGSLNWGGFFAGVGALGPFIYVTQRRKWRFARFEEEFPQSIDFLTRAIRAGHPLSSSIGLVAEEGPPEVSSEFRRVFEEQKFGIPFEEALLGMVDRTDLIDVRVFAIAVLVQRDVGGNLAETLDNLATTIRRRFYLRRQLRTYTAQGRLTGYTLAALPPLVGVAIFFLNPEFTAILFEHPLGRIMIGTALGLQLLGVLWVRKIINIDL